MVREGREARGWIRADRLSRDGYAAPCGIKRVKATLSPLLLLLLLLPLFAPFLRWPLPTRSSPRSIKKLFGLAFVSRVMNRIDRRKIARNNWKKGPEEIFLSARPHYPTVTFSQLNRRVLRSSYVRKKRRRNSRVATKDFLLRRERVKGSSIVTVLEQGYGPPFPPQFP